MRLIDADAIRYCNYDLDNYHSFRAIDEDEIAEMPTIDAVEVVRCKDCKYAYHHIDKKHIYCHRDGRNAYEMVFLGDDFCSYGERKDE